MQQFPRQNLGPEAAPWGSRVEAEITRLSDALDRRFANESYDSTSNRGTIESLSAQVLAMPTVSSVSSQVTNFALSSGWKSYASANVQVPGNKTQVTVMAVGNAAALDQTTGGVTTCYGRIGINGTLSPEFPASKDAGASMVNNVIAAGFGLRFQAAPGGVVTVTLDLQPLNAAPFKKASTNLASLTAIILFSGT